MRIATGVMLGAMILNASGGAATRADNKSDVLKELEKFHGAWTFASVESGGKELPIDGFKDMTVTFEGDKYTVKVGDKVIQAATQKLDPSQSPKTLDVTITEGVDKGSVLLGVYEISGDTLKVCFDSADKKRPTEFKTGAGSQTLVVHKRVKK